MRLLLINPRNHLVQLTEAGGWNRYRVWQPLGLMVVAALTPPTWSVQLLDENLGSSDLQSLPRPDLVGLTAFTAQAERGYEIAAIFRAKGVPVVMGGIHATMRLEEALAHVDAVVTGEAEGVWPTVLADAAAGSLRRHYPGGLAAPGTIRSARHDLLPGGYAFGAVQTSRGCPLNCSFCSVTAFNGGAYRQRPIDEVVAEFRLIPENLLLVVDDNLIGTTSGQLIHAKELLRALAAADVAKQWVAQVTINFADDPELLALARAAGCRGVFIGFEATSPEGLAECGKKFNLLGNRDFAASVERIHRYGILVVGSFIIGLDSDGPGVGRRIAAVARGYGIDLLNAVLLTPLPGTRLFERMADQGRIVCDRLPGDWRFYTFMYPVARFRQLSGGEAMAEMRSCNRRFYSVGAILRRVIANLVHWRMPLFTLIGNLSYRSNAAREMAAYRAFIAGRAGSVAGAV